MTTTAMCSSTDTATIFGDRRSRLLGPMNARSLIARRRLPWGAFFSGAPGDALGVVLSAGGWVMATGYTPENCSGACYDRIRYAAQ